MTAPRPLRGALLAAALALSGSPASAFVRLYPVFGADLLGGQYFFNGNTSSWGGNFDLRAVPAVKFSENFMLIPSLCIGA